MKIYTKTTYKAFAYYLVCVTYFLLPVAYDRNAGPGQGPWSLTHKWLWIHSYSDCDVVDIQLIRRRDACLHTLLVNRLLCDISMFVVVQSHRN